VGDILTFNAGARVHPMNKNERFFTPARIFRACFATVLMPFEGVLLAFRRMFERLFKGSFLPQRPRRFSQRNAKPAASKYYSLLKNETEVMPRSGFATSAKTFAFFAVNFTHKCKLKSGLFNKSVNFFQEQTVNSGVQKCSKMNAFTPFLVKVKVYANHIVAFLSTA